MDENLKITIIGLLTLVLGTIFATVAAASFGTTAVLPELLSFVIAAAIAVLGFNFTNRHFVSKH